MSFIYLKSSTTTTKYYTRTVAQYSCAGAQPGIYDSEPERLSHGILTTRADMADDFELQLEAMERLDELRRTTQLAAQQREKNCPPLLKGIRTENEKNKGNLKSDLKKCTAFVKKIRSITAEGLAQCARDIEVLNMSLYIDEIVAAIVESNFKSTDVPPLVKLCVQLHQRYIEFTEPLVTGLKAALLEDGEESGKRRRIQLRFVVELFQAGVMRDEEFFVTLLLHLLGKGGRSKQGGGGKGAVDVSGLVTFIKYAAEPLLGHISKKTLALIAAAGSSANDIDSLGIRPGITSAKISRELGQLVAEAADNMCMDLVKAFAEFKRCERKSEKDTVIHGALTEQKQQELNDLRKLYEKLLSAATSICECLDLDVPALKEEKEEEVSGTKGLSVWDSSTVSVDYGPFGDAEGKAFYDDLPDLLVMVPLTTLGLSSEQAAALREEWQKKRESRFMQGDDDETVITNAERSTEERDTADTTDISEDVAIDGGSAVDDKDAPSGTTALRLNVLLNEKLPECNNKQRADEFCSSFCYICTKKARKNLVLHLSRIPKGRTDLIPNYARVLASLSRLYPDIVPPVLESVYGCFIGKHKSKFQFDFDGKARNIRYIGELVKFSIAPPIMAFRIFNKLFSEFINQNVLLCAILLETCGRFLYLLPYTHDRVEAILDTVLRLRRAKNLDSNSQMALESAYFTVKPPERKEVRKKKELSRPQQYIRHLFSKRLSTAPGSVDKVIRELRKLPWTSVDEQVDYHVIKACMRTVRTKFVDVPLAADVLSGLARYHPKLQVNLLDTITEELHRGMENPRKREPQRLLGLARFLGECYNFSMINSTTIFDFLYLFLNYGHEMAVGSKAATSTPALEALMAALSLYTVNSESAGSSATPISKLSGDVLRIFQNAYDVTAASDIDSPTDLFRAQLVVEVLRACGCYFVRGVLRDRLSRFLLHFQRYLLCKAHIPMHIEFAILELFDELEVMAASAALKAAQSKKPPKGKKVPAGPDLESMTLIFPRFDSFQAVQDEITLRYGEDVAECDSEDEEEDRLVPGQDRSRDDDEGVEECQEEGEDFSPVAEEGDSDAELSEANAAHLMTKLRQQEEEDDEFEKAFRNAMLESVSSAQRGDPIASGTGASASAAVGGMRVVGADRMTLPAVLPKPKNVMKSIVDEGDSDEEEDCAQKAVTPTVKFKLLSRDQRGRYETREFVVNKDAAMVARLEKATEQQRLEKQRLKESVLRYEEESVSGNGGQRKTTVPVAYLGGKDVLTSTKKNQTPVISTKYVKPKETLDKETIPSASPRRDLNLNEFLAVSGEADVRKFQNDVRGKR